MRLGIFTLLNVPHASKDFLALKEISLCTGVAENNDPKGVVGEHIRGLRMILYFQHDPNALDIIFFGSMSLRSIG
jgi:hypothetical protein